MQIIHFVFFLLTVEYKQRRGGGLRVVLPGFLFLLCFPCSADHVRNWPPVSSSFGGLTTNTLNVRKQSLLSGNLSNLPPGGIVLVSLPHTLSLLKNFSEGSMEEKYGTSTCFDVLRHRSAPAGHDDSSQEHPQQARRVEEAKGSAPARGLR